MSGFMGALKNTLNGDQFNVTMSENGAMGYRTTGKALLDLNFSVASLRSADEQTIVHKFFSAYQENRTLALKWLFFARDIREGLGERRLFKTVVTYMAKTKPDQITHLLSFIPEYGRWDDLWEILDVNNPSQHVVMDLIKGQLLKDIANCTAGQNISLLAKWLPSINASSHKSKEYGRKIVEYIKTTERVYRKILSRLRGYLKVIEKFMSAGEWDKINYEAVPGKANLLYSKAFLRRDENRRRSFLAALEKGEAKINSATLFPHEIVHNYNSAHWGEVDATLEGLWNNLPNTVNTDRRIIVVADGSGSMQSSVGNTNVSCLEIANALAIYFAERLPGEFHEKYITFSNSPRLVDFSGMKTLREKINYVRGFDEVSNTDVAAVFKLILQTAVTHKMSQEEIPTDVLILSDMEFDGCVNNKPGDRLFKVISDEWAAQGYKLPRIVFWRLSGRTEFIPMKENELGVALISGFSTNNAKLVLSAKLDPYEVLLETLTSDRYECIKAIDDDYEFIKIPAYEPQDLLSKFASGH